MAENTERTTVENVKTEWAKNLEIVKTENIEAEKAESIETGKVENIETRKRRQISVKEKLAILNMIDSGHKLSAVARQFGISTSTASTIVKERYKIKLLSEYYNISPDRKRMRLGLFRDVDEAVHIWFRQMRSKNSPVNGPMLQQKAKEFAVQLGHKKFEGSSGWLFRFRERFGLSIKAIQDEDRTNVISGIGMTDDEIVASVCHNTVHAAYKSDDQPTTELSLVLYDKNEVPVVENFEVTNYEPTISLQEAISLTGKLTSFLKQQDNVPTDVWKSMNAVSDFISLDLAEQIKQRKITDYFKP